jgi:hypothetical protein
MSRLVVLPHPVRQGPGLCAVEARARGRRVLLKRLDRGEPLPEPGPGDLLLLVRPDGGGNSGSSDLALAGGAAAPGWGLPGGSAAGLEPVRPCAGLLAGPARRGPAVSCRAGAPLLATGLEQDRTFVLAGPRTGWTGRAAETGPALGGAVDSAQTPAGGQPVRCPERLSRPSGGPGSSISDQPRSSGVICGQPQSLASAGAPSAWGAGAGPSRSRPPLLKPRSVPAPDAASVRPLPSCRCR